MVFNLNDLIAPPQRDALLKSFAEKKRLLLHSENLAGIAALLPQQDMNALITANAAGEDVIVIRSGTTVPRQLYLVDNLRRLNVAALHDILSQGASIIFNHIDRRVPRIRALAASIERTLGAATLANAYFSFKSGGAFNQHWDPHDVLVVQLHGRKRWRTWGSPVEHPIAFDRSKLDQKAQPTDEFELAVGDVLFIPRGEAHSASVSDGFSAHISFGIESPTGLDFIDRLKSLAATDALLRKDLPRKGLYHNTGEHDAALKSRLHKLIDSMSIDDYFEFTDTQRRPATQTSLGASVPEASDIVHLTLRRTPLLRKTQEAGEFQVIAGGQTRKLSAVAAAILSYLFKNENKSVDDLRKDLASLHGAAELDAGLAELTNLGFIFLDHGEQ